MGSDNAIKLDASKVADNAQKVPGEQAHSNDISLEHDAPSNNVQTLPKGEDADNVAHIEGTVYELKQTEKAYSEKLVDRSVGIKVDAIDDNKVRIDPSNGSDNAANVAAEVVQDHVLPVDDSHPIEDNHAKIDASSISDRRAKFDAIRRERNAPKLEASSQSAQSLLKTEPLQTKKAVIAPTKVLTREEKIALARKKKSDEFHGRVEAIKNTVTQLNNQLDKLEDNSVELKKVQY